MTDRPKWTMKRWRQLKDLDRLLIECEAINRGNCILSRLPRIIKLAEKLRRSSEGKRFSQCFYYFLQDQAIADIPPRKPKEEQPNG